MIYIYYIVGIQTPISVLNGQAQIGQSALQVTLQLNLPTYQVTGVTFHLTLLIAGFLFSILSFER